MIREKISFLILLLTFYVHAVEIYNDGQSADNWFRNWRKPVTKHTVDDNPIVTSTTTALPKIQEPPSTTPPVRLEVKKTNSFIVAPEIIEGRSVSYTTTVTEQPVVEIKPRRHQFNFGSPEGPVSTELPKSSPTVISWIPESTKESRGSDIKPYQKPRFDFDTVQTEARPVQPEAIPSKEPSNVRAWTYERDEQVKPKPRVSLPEVTTRTEEYTLTPEPSQHDFKATELEISTQPASLEKSPGSIVYRYEEPLEMSTQMVKNISQGFFVTSSSQIKYNCDVENGYYGVVSSCDRFFECKNKALKLFKCSNGLHFDRNAVWPSDPCVEPSKAKCKNNMQIEYKLERNPKPASVKFSAVLISDRIEYICPSKNGYYRLDKECDKFIKCEEGKASSYECAAGLKFNSYALLGQDPCSADVQCKTVVVRPEPDVKFSAHFIKTLPSYSCLKADGYFKSENYCDEFIKCEKSVASLYKCEAGLQFNRYASLIHDPCESENIIGCKAMTVAEPLSEMKISAELISARVDGYSCPTAQGYFRYENDCEKFIKCENSIASSYRCNPGLQFNSYAMWGADPCASIKLVQCRTVIVHPPLIPKLSAQFITTVYNFSCPASDGYYAAERHCDRFYLCENSVASLYQCSTGLQFNHYATRGQDPCADEKMVRCSTHVIQNRPDPKFSAELITRQIEDYKCSSNGYFNLDKECDKFIKCENSIASSYKCLSGLQFNSDAVLGEDPCESEEIIGCKVVAIKPKLDPELKISATAIKIVYDFVCPTSNGYFDSKNECEEFIRCENARASLYKCLPGLQFNRQSTWGEDPCASEAIVRCKPVIIEPKPLPPPKISATLISRVVFDFTCPTNNGYFESKNECEKFIKCENAVASLYKCLPGLQFNRDSSWGVDPCEREDIVQCKPVIIEPKPLPPPKFSATLISRIVFDFTCPTNNGYFESKNECENFIKCENAMASLYKCLPGLQYNRDSSWGLDPCAREDVVRCKPVIIEPKPLPPPKFSATLISRIVFDFTCPTNNGYFESKNECQKFIKCENAVASLYKCLPGLLFNREATWGSDPCASEAIVHCKPVVIEPKPLPPPQFSATLLSRIVYDYTCPANNRYFRSKNECEEFIKCEDSRASSYKCWSGLQFNPRALWGQDPCAKESEVGCKAVTLPPPTTPKPKFSAILISSQLMDYKCQESSGYFGIDNNCERFVKCEFWIPSLYMCPSGLQFNRRARFGEDPCASASVVMCEVRTTTTTTIKPPPILSYTLIIQHMLGYTCSAPNGYYSVKGECAQFVECKNYIPSLYKCKSGLYFNRFVAWGADPCAEPSIARCEQVAKRPPGPIEPNENYQCTETDGMFPLNSFECSKYVMCRNGRGIVMPCPAGLVFNTELQNCDWPVNVPSCNPEFFHGFSCPAARSDDFNNLTDEIISFKYEDSCRKYIACQHGHPRLLSCDLGLAFSEEHQACVHAERVPSCRR